MDGIIIPERLGNLHLVLLHLPIGFVAAAVMMEFWRWKRPSTEGAWLQGRLLAANAVVSLLTAGAGLLLATTGSYDADVLAWHRWAGVVCAGLAIVVWLTYVRAGVGIARVSLGVLFVATTVAGYLGATLTHGERITNWLAGGASFQPMPVLAAAKPDALTTSAMAVLDRSCIECHSPHKSRGKLRLDTREAALAGGKSGRPAFVPGKPKASEMLRRVKLPRDDEQAMPSSNDPGLSASEIKTLEAWITAGARWP